MRVGRKTFILLFILLGLIFILILSNIPNSRLVNTIKINRGDSNHYLLKVDLPDQIWNGQKERIYLQFTKESIQPVPEIYNQNDKDIHTEKIQNLEINIVLNGAELSPPGISITPIREEKDIIKYWKIKALIDQDIQGSVWVYINTLHEDHGEEDLRELIFTQDISIKNKMILGLKIGTIQWILVTMIIGILLLLSLSLRKSRFNDINK